MVEKEFKKETINAVVEITGSAISSSSFETSKIDLTFFCVLKGFREKRRNGPKPGIPHRLVALHACC